MATVTRYINTASSGGDGTTNGTAGATAAYASFDAWHAAEATNLVSAGDNHIVYCCGTADSPASAINFGGTWTTDATHTVTVAANTGEADGFNTGTAFSTSHYHLKWTSPGGTSEFDLGGEYFIFDGIQFLVDGATQTVQYLILDNNAVGDFRRCRFWISAESTGSRFSFIGLRPRYVRNCTFECTQTGTANEDAVAVTSAHNGNTDIVNCTAYGFQYGFIFSTASTYTTTLLNTAVFNCGDDMLNAGGAGTNTINYCATEDADGTNAVTITNVANTFTDYANKDLTIKDASSVIFQAGTSSGSLLTEDIQNETIAQYSIGAYDGGELASSSLAHRRYAIII